MPEHPVALRHATGQTGPLIPRGAGLRRQNEATVGLLDLTATAKVLGTTPRHVRTLIRERGLPFVKVGHLVRVDADDLTAWIAASRQVSP